MLRRSISLFWSAPRDRRMHGIVTHVLVRRLNGSLCRENRGAWSPKRATWSCGRLRVRQHKGWSWIQRIPCARRISSHSHGNPIARLYASLALETELTPLNPGWSVQPRYYSHLCRPFVRPFVWSCRCVAAARNDDLSCKMRMSDRSFRLIWFPSTNWMHFFPLPNFPPLSDCRCILSRLPTKFLSRALIC